MSGRYPDFFIIGAMKSATSSIHDQLAALPGIFMSEPKEPNFFSDESVFRRGFDWYRALFSSAADDDLAGESSTHYAKLPTYPNTVARIAASVPAPKIIYVMRHPLDRLVSQYIHEWSQGKIREDIDTAILSHPELTDYSCYHYQLQPYIEQFGRDSILPVFFDHLKADPDSELRRLCEFIGRPGPVSWRRDLSPSNVSSERIRKFPLYSLLVESAPMCWLRRALVPGWVRNRVKRRLTMQERPEVSPESARKVTEVFDRDLRLLGELLGVELNCRNFCQVTAARPLYWRSDPRGAG